MGIVIHEGSRLIAWIFGFGMTLLGGYSLRDFIKEFKDAKKEKHLTLWAILEFSFEILTLNTIGWFILFLAGLLILIALSIDFFRIVLN
ncbi:hypothetical protein [Paenibacillus sp. LHD-38]|uniref:hypothetical protein n=1 Tax=Paenibacillus sp. LHD-38 TaxID=3072143 RepID=UPI00280DA051|nr:hypothetical protein [Paenibacillus sp. LHD-38]MDQ8738894.1 hypothetical protein [Paenibacillus sp. LHD-38]